MPPDGADAGAALGLPSGWSDALTDDCGAASPLVDSVEMVDIVFVERFGPTRSMVSKRAREPAVAAASAALKCRSLAWG